MTEYQCGPMERKVWKNKSYVRILGFFQEKVNIRIARIFNTFGPRMHMNDGRVVSNFILQGLQNEPITVSIH